MRKLIRLRVGIAAAYAFIMIPLTTGMVGYLYNVNKNLMLETAAKEMRQATESVRRDLSGLLEPVQHVVNTSAELLRSDVRRITEVHNMGYFGRQLDALPQVFSVYAGFAGQGDFYQIYHLPPSLSNLGPWSRKHGEVVQYAVRSVTGTRSGRDDRYIFYDDWGDIQYAGQVPARYDPRVRPWYNASVESDEVVYSDAYVFSSSKMVGITLSRRIATSTGHLLGVLGADVTLEALSAFLRKTQIGEGGRVFILDENCRMIAHRDAGMGVSVVNGTVRLLSAIDVPDAVTAMAARTWISHGKETFDFKVPKGGDGYMASFSKIPLGSGRYWTIGVLVDKEELIGPIRAASLKILMVGVVITILAMLAIYRFSKSLTYPIKQIVAKTDRLRQFDLEGDLEDVSRIKEVHQLTAAVQTMTRSLRSFSVYVPREVVRAIVSDNAQTSLTSRRQVMTVMMSDIADYTRTTEDAAPERVVALLNRYFDSMTKEIHGHKGIVDKYIGDAIMAIWNAPTKDLQHVRNACHAALACRDAGLRLAEQFKTDGEAPYITRFGLHTGEAVVGNVGSSDRMQYSAIGSMINLTSRLESMNKAFGTNILISEDIADEIVPEFVVRCVDCVVPVGTTKSIMVYELLDKRNTLEERGEMQAVQKRCDVWQSVLQLYFDGQWLDALAELGLYRAQYPNDPVTKVFIERCKAYQKNPPPAGWDGARVLTAK